MTFLTSSELAEIQGRLEQYLGLPEGDLRSSDFASRMQPFTYRPQDSSGPISSARVTPSMKDQVALDLWRLLKVAETIYSDG